MTITPEDAIKAASSVARDVADGRLDPAQLERQAVAELKALMLVEPEPGSDLEALHTDSARRVLARGGIPADEVAEWLAVQRRRENLDISSDPPAVVPVAVLDPVGGADLPSGAGTAATAQHGPEYAALTAHSEPEPVTAVDQPKPVAPSVKRHVLARGRALPVDNGLRPL